VLSQAEIDSFTADGYVAVRGAVPADVLRLCQDEIWSALGEHGVRRGPARRVPAGPAPEPGRARDVAGAGGL